jgi:hypothetical protein
MVNLNVTADGAPVDIRRISRTLPQPIPAPSPT